MGIGGHRRRAIILAEPYVERLIGSIRRECLDHLIILSKRHLRQYHHDARAHLSLNKDCP